jgi:hypothetical protein
MRPRGRIGCVHALSSFQRTKAPAARTVRRPLRHRYLPAAAPIRDRLSSLCRACRSCQPLFQLRRVGLTGPFRLSSGGFQNAYLAARALDRGHRVKRVSPIYETNVSLSTPGLKKSHPDAASSVHASLTPRFARGDVRAGPSGRRPAYHQSCRTSPRGDDHRSPAHRSGRRRPA